MTKQARNVQIIHVSLSLFSSSILQEFASYSTSPRCFWPSRAKKDSETIAAKWTGIEGGRSLGQRGSNSPKLSEMPAPSTECYVSIIDQFPRASMNRRRRGTS